MRADWARGHQARRASRRRLRDIEGHHTFFGSKRFGVPVWIAAWIAGACGLGLFIPRASGTAQEVLVGVAREELVLPQRVPLAGYSRRKGKPSTGVHDPVAVRALVLKDAQTTAVLVSCDLLIIDERLFEAVRRRLVERGFPASTVLLVAATHTHSGPGGYGTTFLEKVSMGHFDARVFEEIVERVARAVQHAADGAAPARVAHRSATVNGLSTNRVVEGGPVETELTVTAWYREAPEPFAIIVGFSAHPTALGAWNREVSADYPGVLVREVERRFPSARCVFFAGSVGDQAPATQGEGFGRAETLGRLLASHVIGAIEHAVPVPLAGLQARQAVVPLAPARVRLGRMLVLPRWLGASLVDDDATVTVVAAGGIVWLGVPCDLVASLGEELKRAARAQGYAPVIVGFSDDYIGYCVTEAVYRTAEYEALMAFNGPETGSRIVEHLRGMVEALPVKGGE